MNIGYACLTVGVANTDQKSCMLKNVSESKLSELISYNLNSLENLIEYNIKKKIRLFRISSDLIPFGSSPANTLTWWDLFAPQLLRIGDKIKRHGIRVSMHPGQYTVLNSPDSLVVEKAIADLNYHNKVLESLGMGADHKIILHIGGVYNNKNEAVERFVLNYNTLEDSVKQRLVIENDDKSYNIQDVLDIGMKLNIPVVFDNLHHLINPGLKIGNDSFWINECKTTWKEKDGPQKIHYSQQDPMKRPGSHSSTIRIKEFLDFYNKLEAKDLDIMLEVKDKNLSAVKCINCTRNNKIKALEMEWSKYKYFVLEKHPENYNKIRKLLKDKTEYPAIDFYVLVEEAMESSTTLGNSLNALLHVWGYFKKTATEKEKLRFLKMSDEYQQGVISDRPIKNFLRKMAIKYQQDYLLDSYYFVL